MARNRERRNREVRTNEAGRLGRTARRDALAKQRLQDEHDAFPGVEEWHVVDPNAEEAGCSRIRAKK